MYIDVQSYWHTECNSGMPGVTRSFVWDAGCPLCMCFVLWQWGEERCQWVCRCSTSGIVQWLAVPIVDDVGLHVLGCRVAVGMGWISVLSRVPLFQAWWAGAMRNFSRTVLLWSGNFFVPFAFCIRLTFFVPVFWWTTCHCCWGFGSWVLGFVSSFSQFVFEVDEGWL